MDSFEPPQDWCPEDSDNVEATLAAYEVFKRIIASGHQLDVVDVWDDMKPEEVEIVRVVLSEVSADHFRFFENRKFIMYA